MNVIKQIKMDLTEPDTSLQVCSVQGDTGSRYVEIALYAGGNAWTVPEGTGVLISYHQPGGGCACYDTLEDGSAAWEIAGNKVTVALVPQMLTEAGLVAVQIKLICGEKTLNTFTFYVHVRAGLSPGDDPGSYVSWLDAYLPQVSGAAPGQYLQVTGVDSDGHITALTSVDTAGGGGGYYLPAVSDDGELSWTNTMGLENPSPVNIQGPRGLTGTAGRTPVKGKDYFTEDELAGIKADVADSIRTDIAAMGQISPVYVSDISECSDTGAVYVLPDGMLYVYDEDSGEWIDTGIAFVSPDLDERFSTLEELFVEHGSWLTEHDDRLRVLERAVTTYPEAWDDAVSACIDQVRACQAVGGRNSVSFAFFSDNHQRMGYCGALIAKVMEECAIPYSFFCGDLASKEAISGRAVREEQARKFDTVMSAIPAQQDCRALGEWDGYWVDENGLEFHMDWSKIYDLYFRKQSLAQNRVFGGDGSYYYVEDKASKVRFVVLNSVWMEYVEAPDGTAINPDGYGFGQEQLDWLVQEGLSFPEEGWAVVFLAHSPITNDHDSNLRDAGILQQILWAFANKTAYSGSYTAGVQEGNHVTVDVDFTNAVTAEMIGWFAGHIHRDRLLTVDDTTSSDYFVRLPFQTVTITSDADDSYDADITEERDLDGSTGHAIDFVTIDRATKTVYLTRLGCGEDRTFTYG